MKDDPGALADLERWAADARARDAADARVRERWLRAQAEESASLLGALIALAERQETVVVTTVADRRHRGVIAGVGADFAVVVASDGMNILIGLHVVANVRNVPASRRSTAAADDGHRRSLGVRLADVLAQAAGQRPRVAVQAGAASVAGDLRAVGSDVLTLRTDEAGVVYVRLESVSEVSFLASG